MTRKTIYETNFDRLVKLDMCSTEGKLRPYGCSEASGYMDLILEPVPTPESVGDKECQVFSLAHYFLQNGDLCQDPEMELLLYPELKAVEAFSFTMAIPPIYQVVYPEVGKYVPTYKKELNSFLRQWLNNLIDQQHGKVWIDKSQ